jgi:hypothetical protein
MELIKFKDFLTEEEIYENTILMEESGAGAGADTKGKLHELLVGYHLRGGRHMEKYKNEDQMSPKQAHDMLKAKVSKEEYDKIKERARQAAEHIKHHIEKHHGHKIQNVHWTSKAGDIGKSTGVESSQKEDASDIMIHTRDKKGRKRYHGISLKVTDSRNRHVPVSNPGMASMHGAEETLEKHRKRVRKEFPEIKNMNKKEQKKYVKDHPNIVQKRLRELNTHTLNKIAKDTHKHLESLTTEQLAHHIKTHILQAHQTPLQKQGHHHLRHTTYSGSGGEHNFHAVNPHEHYAPYLTDHKQLKVHRRGTSIVFTHGGKEIARQRIKFTSQSDPTGGIKSSGEPKI